MSKRLLSRKSWVGNEENVPTRGKTFIYQGPGAGGNWKYAYSEQTSVSAAQGTKGIWHEIRWRDE